MTSRIHIARPEAPPSYSADPHGLSNSRSPSGFAPSIPQESDNFQEKLRKYAAQVEDYIEIYSQPLKPHLPSIGRFLIVVTFLEDAWRIMTQWSDQLWYLQKCVRVLLFCKRQDISMIFVLLDTENSRGDSHISSLRSTSSYVPFALHPSSDKLCHGFFSLANRIIHRLIRLLTHCD